ncbi:hypothetical protein SS50377_24538 [Spironucleus salmonicida]|uniref:CFA20 domain-containing protein n=1 Tax=Spironucleus salmonicida TaxID=348837 RepID=V6LMR3_9EUKA|nr:hypothetical protein SS50377_24538 [Spironucleus salmonicida]|eukprot:EST45920.1 hypothetical protein SS50377_13896 [Spironucleus salmonicida]
MFKEAFQGGSHIMLLEAKGSKPMDIWDVKKASANRLYNKEMKTYVIDITGNHLNTIKCPPIPEKLPLGITQSYLAMQMFLPKDQPLSLHITLFSASKSKMRITFSTSVKVVKSANLLARVPLHMVAGTWSMLVLDLHELTRSLFPQQEFSSLHSLEISPYCTLLRVFSLKTCPLPTIELFCQQDEIECARNPKMPLPQFSKRCHEILSEKLSTPMPIHVQIVDIFYISLFKEGKVNSDISVRDQSGIVQARENFLPGFNNFGLEEEQDHRITKMQQSNVGRAPGKQEVEEIYKNYRPQTPEKNRTPVKTYVTPKQVVAKSTPQQKTKIPQVSAVQAVMEELKKNDSQQLYHAAISQAAAIDKRNLETDFTKDKEQRIQQNLVKLNKNKPPAVLKSTDSDYCAQDVDLTISAVPVEFNCGQCSDKNDGKSLTPVKRVNSAVSGYYKEVKKIEKLVKEEEIYENDDQPQEEIHQEEINDDQENPYCEQQQQLYQEEVQENETNSAQYQPQDDIEEYNDTCRSVEYTPKQQTKDITQDNIPDPEFGDNPEQQNLIPDPAEEGILADPVAFGLFYDPVTKSYYEKLE